MSQPNNYTGPAQPLYYVADTFGNTAGGVGGGSSQSRLSADFSAPSVAAATQTAFLICAALQRPGQLVACAGQPPWTQISPQAPTTALTACLSGIGY